MVPTMTPLTLFAATIGFIAAVHMMSTVFEHFGKAKYLRGHHQSKR